MTKRLTIALIALLALAMIAMLPAAAAHVIPNNGTVFRGEQGLDIGTTIGIVAGNTLAWYAAGSNPATDAPQATMVVTNPASFFVDPGMNLGAWYVVGGGAAFVVADPTLAISVWDMNNVDRTDAAVIRLAGLPQSELKFRIISNLDAMASQRGFIYPANLTIRVGTPDGNVFTTLINASGQQTALTPGNPFAFASNQTAIRSNPWWVYSSALTQQDVWDVSNAQYKRGIYTFWATCNVNSMNDNYNVVGKTKTTTHTIELIDEDTTITANKDVVVRNNDFAVTITGRPNTYYALWVKGSSSESNITVPRIKTGQQGVVVSHAPVGAYTWKTGTTVTADTPGANALLNLLADGTGSYANVTTNDNGVRTVQFMTNQSTNDKTFTIRVQRTQAGVITDDYDEVKLKVEKGAVTITASGDRTYYLGQEVTLSGTNSDSGITYLFITGPNLPGAGGDINAPSTAITAGGATNIAVQRTVKSDDTWDYKWMTGDAMLDPGTYTIYAVSQENDKNNLANVKYGTVSVVIRKGFITATPSATTVAKGDKLYVRGTAEGEPANIQIWLFGVNKFQMEQQNVEDDASFEYEITGATTAGLSAGQYFIVAQHPMANGQFDVLDDDTTVAGLTFIGTRNALINNIPAANAVGAELFIAEGNGRLQGSDAAEALTRMLDLQSIDDTYTKLTFLVEEPWIRLDTVGDKYVGTKFTITGTTNLAVDNELIVEVTSSSFKPTDKTASGEFAGQSGVVKVVQGDAGYNTFSMEVDASGFTPDEYIVKIESIEADATTTATFNVLEGVPVTQPPATQPPATQPPATVVPTQPPATPASPGFGALVAIAGLGAVAFLVLRRD
ncbi:MEMAR_RS02690 family S-layer glycoprotein [Methanocalculus sp.]|uniref:MEMAR_RS02690 family S-layer glycoprotein n=1 Tax=Methanocalculus sp. TaxID=2004547 RepID=UPI0026338554|nr:MEMAR_RS02690 family S-layer glycoprotein [Methanocalculus sp.]MDG6250578.1 MEMAR_RS02690 family S-layer glycoprotein [Methanocalculus sp.]